MGSDNFFKKKREERKKRKHDLLTPKPNSFLIVSEGERTEPNYFQGLADYITSRFGGNIDVMPTICVEGEGMCTVSLVREAEKIVNRAPIIYENIWVVFDKDDFTDFDEAIKLAQEIGFHAAWSNQAFEYWLYLHFFYTDSALHRSVLMEKLSEIFKTRNIGNNKYEKNMSKLFELVAFDGGLKNAVNNSKRISSSYKEQNLPPSQTEPCTTVHELILALKPYLEKLLV